MFDSSKEHILEAVDGILKRLDVEYLDSLLIHRPDLLVETEEVAEAFDKLETSGKVRYFGVSNENPMEMELLKKICETAAVCQPAPVWTGTYGNAEPAAGSQCDYAGSF